MIKFNSNNINDWYYNTSDIIKVYRNGAVCYYKISVSGGTSGQTPCFAVVDNISQYSDTEFEDVFNKADNKWYKLNNLNQYEEYGIYGEGRNITYYDGKLTVDDGYEYMYSGGSWANVGEVSGSSVVEYIETPTSSPYAGIELLTSPSSKSTPMYYEVDCLVKSNQGDNSILGQKSNRETVSYQFGFQAYNSPYYDYGGRRLSTNWPGIGGLNNRIKVGFGVNSGDSKVVIKNLATSTIVQSTTATPTNVTIPLLCNAKYYTNTSGDNYATSGQVRYYGIKIYDNNVLVGDYIPAKNTSTNEYTFYETISHRYCSKIGSGTIAGAETGTTEYPVYYDEIQDPPNNLSFSSMTEAEEYECPWVGMKATIDGDKYIFSGDSTSGYEWVYNPSKLPQGYTEVEYIENKNRAYIDTGFKPNQDTRIVFKMQCVTSTSYGRLIGCGNYNKANGIQFDYETGYNGTLHISWGHLTSWTIYSNCVGDYNVHEYDWDKNYFYRDKGTTNQFSASTTYTNFQCTDNLGIFTYINNGQPSSNYSTEALLGKMFSFQIYDNGTLVRDLVPCIRDNDNTVGAYDIVNDVFYYPPNYASYPLIAGNPI